RDFHVTGVQTCALPIWTRWRSRAASSGRLDAPPDEKDSPGMGAPKAAVSTPWIGLFTLAGAVFVSVTSELLPTGLLPQMAEGLGVSQSRIGLLVAIFA